jgi:hypothetical protein
MRVAPAIALSPEDRDVLLKYRHRRRVARRLAERSAIVLLAAEGRRNAEIAEALRTAPATVARWRRRFITQGVAGLEKDAPRPGRTPAIGPEMIAKIVPGRLRDANPPDALEHSDAGAGRGRKPVHGPSRLASPRTQGFRHPGKSQTAFV